MGVGSITGSRGSIATGREAPDPVSGVTPDSVIEKQDQQSPAELADENLLRAGPNLVDPKVRKEDRNPDGTPMVSSSYFAGPLYKDGADFRDVQQGKLGDCYFAAAMSALAWGAKAQVDALETKNADGTYTVKLYNNSYTPRRYAVKVDGDLYVKPTGTPQYGRSTGDKTPAGMELWFPLAEKAFAKMDANDYDNIEGGLAGQVFQAVLGKRGEYASTSRLSPDALWSRITTAMDNNWPTCAGTSDDEDFYKDTGVYADHMYTVVGYEEQNGERYVKLRNPWGISEPAGNGADDGEFRLTLADFQKLYPSLEWVRA